MDSSKDTLMLDAVAQAMKAQMDLLTQALTNISGTLTDQICNLTLKLGAIEAVQLRLFSALAETNPKVHSEVVVELAAVLAATEDLAPNNAQFADHLRALTGVKAESKPLLRLVPKKPVVEPEN